MPERFIAGDEESENGVLLALIELHRRKQRVARRSVEGNDHGYVVDQFERRAKRLRTELLLTEELIERSLGAARALPAREPQQELAIVGPLGGTASGRFRVQNRLAHAAVVEFVVGEAFSGPTPALQFEPKSVELAGGAVALVKVTADLRMLVEPATCTIPIECRSRGYRDRLWLVVTAFDRGEVAR